ncbi:hypothetical protein FIV42_24655 [Persicimonas caeni]|uniref:Uncharacterized protein n=1 Tax=Persicimonas caeni TaxID=2292766 RepID=A0A4Y6PZR6_PERCE|nr:hypothetical protein [Persicimonas caeni]QDG53818.1 hypothetical protein FIV42_24655 [Persicimonas caeni]QED35039.1 hypothetical protein FRD00_24650 [Persicimonas caeni]
MEAFEEVLAEVFAWVRLGIEVLGAVLCSALIVRGGHGSSTASRMRRPPRPTSSRGFERGHRPA